MTKLMSLAALLVVLAVACGPRSAPAARLHGDDAHTADAVCSETPASTPAQDGWIWPTY